MGKEEGGFWPLILNEAERMAETIDCSRGSNSLCRRSFEPGMSAGRDVSDCGGGGEEEKTDGRTSLSRLRNASCTLREKSAAAATRRENRHLGGNRQYEQWEGKPRTDSPPAESTAVRKSA